MAETGEKQPPVEEIPPGPYANVDLLPTPPEKRTWGIFTFFSVWAAMAICIPTYMLGSSMIAAGLDFATSMAVITIGSLIMGLIVVANSHAGAKYGIPFPVQARAAFGIRGAHVPAIMRAVAAAGWYGIELWIGAEALDILTQVFYPAWKDVPGHIWYWFIIFLIMNLVVILYAPPWKACPAIKWLCDASAPLLLVAGVGWCWILVSVAGGLGPVIGAPPKLTGMEYWTVTFSMLVVMTFYWSTVGVNCCDFARFAPSQKVHAIGQPAGITVGQAAYVAIGCIVTSAGFLVFREFIWDPVALTGRLGIAWFAVFALVVIALATLTTNVAANVVATNMVFMNCYPKKINWVWATVISTIVAIAMQPWKLLETWGAYVYTWLTGYGNVLGAILGILLVDYYLIRKKTLFLRDLYMAGGRYWYRNGINWAAIIALVIAIAIVFPGIYVPALFSVYMYGPAIAMAIGAVVYLIAAKASPAVKQSIAP